MGQVFEAEAVPRIEHFGKGSRLVFGTVNALNITFPSNNAKGVFMIIWSWQPRAILVYVPVGWVRKLSLEDENADVTDSC